MKKSYCKKEKSNCKQCKLANDSHDCNGNRISEHVFGAVSSALRLYNEKYILKCIRLPVRDKRTIKNTALAIFDVKKGYTINSTLKDAVVVLVKASYAKRISLCKWEVSVIKTYFADIAKHFK